MVSKQDVITILFTFICGLIAGIYLFVVGFMSQVSDVVSSLSSDNDSDKSFSIEGYQYGICELDESCQSYNILDSGSYTYILSSIPSEYNMLYGTLSKKEWGAIKDLLASAALESLANENDSFQCLNSYKENNYRYIVRSDGVFFILDTCNERFLRASVLYSQLDLVWELIQSKE
jgi:hypothetical protein